MHLLALYCLTPWALHPSTLDLMDAVLLRWATGERLSAEQIGAAIGDAPALNAARVQRTAAASGGGVQVIPVYGVLAHRAHQVANSSQPLTSVESLANAVRAARDNPDVGQIVLDVDSPGGSAFGVQELSDVIFETRQVKPVTAVVNSMAASGGYWIASQASEIVVTPSGMVGSIGVITSHIDASAAYAARGLVKTHITAGKYKAEGADTGPLDEDARASLQGMVDKFYAAFTGAVKRGRGAPLEAVRGPAFGEGRMKLAKDAVDSGMADRIGTLDETLARLQRTRRGASARGITSAQAAIDISILEA